MITTKTKTQLALDMLNKRAEGKLDKKLRYKDEDKAIVAQAVTATNAMFELKAGFPFIRGISAVKWNLRWKESADIHQSFESLMHEVAVVVKKGQKIRRQSKTTIK